MKTKVHIMALVIVGVLVAAGYGLYAMGTRHGASRSAMTGNDSMASPQAVAPKVAVPTNESAEDATRRHVAVGIKAGDIDPANGKKILYYHDPMVPGNKFEKPGKSPFMDMMMSPVYADSDTDQGRVTVSSRIQQSLGVRTAEVTEGALSPQVSAVGSIAFNERDQAIVQARATGYVEHLHVRATLDPVAKGQPLVSLYVPDWIAAQEEFLSVQRMQGTDLGGLLDGARQRMRQVGMDNAQIALVERSGKTQPRITLTAPLAGVVVELSAREGMTVMPGTTLFRINGLSTVWANAEVPESQAALVRLGAKVQARSPAAPGSTFDGKVQAILPEVNPSTRTLKARLELANPGSRLVPGMFVMMNFVDVHAEKTLLVPTEALIRTGKRTVVIVAEDNGRFRPIDVEAGLESGGQTEIKRGLSAGMRVVVSSQFLIDSEASLKGAETRLNSEPDASAASASTTLDPMVAAVPRHVGEAQVVSVGKDRVMLSHGAIPTMNWGSMTMDFKLPADDTVRRVRIGDRVRFEFLIGADNLPQLTHITLLTAADKRVTPTGSKP